MKRLLDICKHHDAEDLDSCFLQKNVIDRISEDFFMCFQLHDYRKFPSADMEVKFQLSSVTLEPMLRSMAYISEQLSAPANRVAVINLKVCFLYSR